jgi:hypothetical protein
MDFAMKDWAIDSPKEKHFRDLMRKGYLDIVGAYFSFSEALGVAKDLVAEAKEKRNATKDMANGEGDSDD